MTREERLLKQQVLAFKHQVDRILSEGLFVAHFFNEASDLARNQVSGRFGRLRRELSRYIPFQDLADIELDSSADLEHLQREMDYICEILPTVFPEDDPSPDESKSAFTKDELTQIDYELSALQVELTVIIKSSELDDKRALWLEQVIKSEIANLKEDARKLSRKDWKNQLLSFAMSIVMLFSFSTEARQTVQHAYESIAAVCYEVSPDAVPLPKELAAPPDHPNLDE